MRSEDLDGLTEKYPDCIIAAYADIGTGVTLLTNSGRTFPREALDELCVEAALTLGAPDAPALGAIPCIQAIKTDTVSVFVYLRALNNPDDALICMCRPSITLEPFLSEARAVLERGA